MPSVYVKNAAGDQQTASFWVKLFPKKFHQSTIPLTDAMMQRIVNDIDPDGKIPAAPSNATSTAIANCGNRTQNSFTICV